MGQESEGNKQSDPQRWIGPAGCYEVFQGMAFPYLEE